LRQDIPGRAYFVERWNMSELTKQQLDILIGDVERASQCAGEKAMYEMTVKKLRSLADMAQGYLRLLQSDSADGTRDFRVALEESRRKKKSGLVAQLKVERERRESAEKHLNALLDVENLPSAHAQNVRVAAAGHFGRWREDS
jgi:hypothetical protein